jgi:hypothetical protein
MMRDAFGVALKGYRRTTRFLGMLSLALPVLVAIPWVVMEANPQLGGGANGYGGVFIAIALYVGTVSAVIAGIICGSLSLILETNKAGGFLGISMSVALGFWLYTHL